MSLPVLRIFDFDQTISHAHTFHFKSFYTAENNTKKNIDSHAKFDANNIVAVATYHDDVDYVLSYLLRVLHLNKADIRSREVKNFPRHKISKFYFHNSPHPILISSVDKNEFRCGGKNQALEDICAELPPCSANHFFDDDDKNIILAIGLGKFVVHQVDKEKQQFTVSPSLTLSCYLNHYKKERLDCPYRYRGWGAFFSLYFLGYTQAQKIAAVDALLHSLKTGESLDPVHYGPLQEGKLGKAIETWKNWSQISFEQLIQDRKMMPTSLAPVRMVPTFSAFSLTSLDSTSGNNAPSPFKR